MGFKGVNIIWHVFVMNVAFEMKFWLHGVICKNDLFYSYLIIEHVLNVYKNRDSVGVT